MYFATTKMTSALAQFSRGSHIQNGNDKLMIILQFTNAGLIKKYSNILSLLRYFRILKFCVLIFFDSPIDNKSQQKDLVIIFYGQIKAFSKSCVNSLGHALGKVPTGVSSKVKRVIKWLIINPNNPEISLRKSAATRDYNPKSKPPTKPPQNLLKTQLTCLTEAFNRQSLGIGWVPTFNFIGICPVFNFCVHLSALFHASPTCVLAVITSASSLLMMILLTCKFRLQPFFHALNRSFRPLVSSCCCCCSFLALVMRLIFYLELCPYNSVTADMPTARANN